MALMEPFPDLEEILAAIGAGGDRVAAIDASEGAAGNISVCVGWPIEIRRRFPNVDQPGLDDPDDVRIDTVHAPREFDRQVLSAGSGRRKGHSILRGDADDHDRAAGGCEHDLGLDRIVHAGRFEGDVYAVPAGGRAEVRPLRPTGH